ADPEACRALGESVGEDPEALAGEIDKLATWSGGDLIGVSEIASLVSGCAEIPGYELTDAWGRRDLRAALLACQTLLDRSGDSVSRAVPALVGLFVGHLGRVRAVQAMAEDSLT